MFAVVFKSLLAIANGLLSNQQNVDVERPTPSKWRRWGSRFVSVISAIGFPLLRNAATGSTEVYDFVNTILSQQTANRPIHREHENGLNRLSRPNFRRRSHRNQRSRICLINPTINITIQRE